MAGNARSLWAMDVTSRVPIMPVGDVRRAIAGFPHPDGYDLSVIPLRYRGDKPHLSAWTDFEIKASRSRSLSRSCPSARSFRTGRSAVRAKG